MRNTRRGRNTAAVLVAASVAVSGLLGAGTAHGADGPSRDVTAHGSGPKTCVPFLGRPTSSGQLPLGVIPPNWGTSGWKRLPPAERQDLPARVTMRDNDESFNQRMDFALRDGRIYARLRSDEQWREIAMPSCLKGEVTAISVNDAMLAAVDANGWVYTLNNLLSSPKDWGWFRAWGSPFWFGRGLRLENQSQGEWALSLIDNQTDRTYRGVDGHDHPVSLAMCTEVMMLSKDGRNLYQHDPWLANDYSFEASTPYNSRFTVHSMSASGSVILVTNSHGDMFTRLWDYDIAGTDPAQFRYTWQPQDNLPSPRTWLQGKVDPRYAAIKLPPAPWKHQPKVPGTITDRLTVVSTAPGSQNRQLRVEGRHGGRTGYWSKGVDAKAWHFVATDEPLKGKVLDNPRRDTSRTELAPPSGVHYSGNLPGGAKVSVRDFAYQSTTRTVDVTVGDRTVPVKLHSIDGRLRTALSMLSHRERGLTSTPRYYDAALEVPESYRDDPALAPFMRDVMKGQRVHEIYLAVTDGSLKIINDPHPAIALKSGRNVTTLQRTR